MRLSKPKDDHVLSVSRKLAGILNRLAGSLFFLRFEFLLLSPWLVLLVGHDEVEVGLPPPPPQAVEVLSCEFE